MKKANYTDKDRDWSAYPPGTKAFAHGGGYWFRTNFGWKWCTGTSFPTPGGDVDTKKIIVPPGET